MTGDVEDLSKSSTIVCLQDLNIRNFTEVLEVILQVKYVYVFHSIVLYSTLISTVYVYGALQIFWKKKWLQTVP